jgi:hemerythrin-like domain-containing protein
MANEQNLVRGEQAHKLTAEEQSKGGKASAEARRKKRDLRRALEILLEKDYTDKKGNVASGAEAITAKLFEQAMKGNVKAFETIRSTVGQDPVQKVEQVNIDAEYEQSVEYVRRLMEKDDE